MDVEAALSIRGLDDDVRERLRIRAARHGRSMEAEIRAILVEAVGEPAPTATLVTALLDRFGELGGVELELGVRATRPRARSAMDQGAHLRDSGGVAGALAAGGSAVPSRAVSQPDS